MSPNRRPRTVAGRRSVDPVEDLNSLVPCLEHAEKEVLAIESGDIQEIAKFNNSPNKSIEEILNGVRILVQRLESIDGNWSDIKKMLETEFH